MKKIILLIAAVFVVGVSFAQELKVEKQTFLYAEKDGQKLYLDRYVPEGNDETKPCLIFVFGGAFKFGARDVDGYVGYFEYMARQGYCVVSIDYRLGYKDYETPPDDGPLEKLNKFENTINIAVEDLFDATNFVLGNAEEWKVDPGMIIASGSSAGAITALQGEFYICNSRERAKVLPEGFNYAGIVSFAGAIFNIGEFMWEKAPCPIQMFHGDADKLVPYDHIAQMGIGFYGSKYIAASLDAAGHPYYFYSAIDSGHELAGDPMGRCRGEIMTFLKNQVKDKKKEQVNTVVKTIGRPESDKSFTLGEYTL
jgi:dienelactone hydrolase